MHPLLMMARPLSFFVPEKLPRHVGCPVLASLAAFANSGIKPALMGAAPVQAIADCLSRSGWKPEDVDHLESNEAFAAQAAGSD